MSDWLFEMNIYCTVLYTLFTLYDIIDDRWSMVVVRYLVALCVCGTVGGNIYSGLTQTRFKRKIEFEIWGFKQTYGVL